MKKRMLILLASAILVLSACGKKIDNAGTASATAGDGASSAQVIQGETKAAGSAAGDDASAEEEGAAPEEEEDGGDEGEIWEEENYEADDPDGTGGEDEGDAADDDSAEGIVEGESPSGEAAASWSGSYLCDSGEALQVQASEDGTTLQFSFAAAGISGSAELSGDQAVYHGDDQVDVIFTLQGGGINVSAQSQEDYGEITTVVSGFYALANP